MGEYYKSRDFLFCSICGTMLSLKSTKHASCPLCKSKKSLKEITGKETRYTISGEKVKYELVDAINSNDCLWASGLWFHCNFRVMLEGSSATSTKLIFAELKVAKFVQETQKQPIRRTMHYEAETKVGNSSIIASTSSPIA